MRNHVDSVYFFCRPLGPPHQAGYQHSIVAFAEGLTELGIPFYANVNYWRQSIDPSSYLLRHDPTVVFGDCALVVVSKQYFTSYGAPPGLFAKDRKYRTVFLDHKRPDPTCEALEDLAEFDVV